MRIGLSALIIAAAAIICMGQQATEDPSPQPEGDWAPQPVPGVIQLPNMTITPANRQIVFQSEVCLRSGMLELLVCGFETKEHESILTTRVRPSHLHAALLMLGLRPGMPSRWFQMDDEFPRAFPPRGAELDIRLRWRDADGAAREVPAGQWLRRVGNEDVSPPEKWIFVGSDMLSDDAYWADGGGEIISVSNFAASVIDVPFTSSSANADLLFVAESAEIPPLGTAVEVIITVSEELPDYARAWVTVDRLGEFYADNQPVSPAALEEWATAFIREYPKGQVVIRSDPRAMGADVQAAMLAVRMGGVWDIVESRFDISEPVLPRTSAQAAEALEQLRADLSEDGIYGDPHADAAATLARIERETAELERLKALWNEYAAHIEQAMEDYPPEPESEDTETP